ncbi:unnamed protein product [Didymodactylos carnosus]|uniref:Uncharacterized protein n=1 Tax=Didymodactylos carnosus TaxID=1234261 RepID=A0A8S2KHC7_9BILA|nr:unnamed protein product [Didymodactylos carnosus]CAF3851791.1 unnamed protein product [Didymodactylos carnosus]
MRAGSSAAAVERPVDLSSPPLISSDLSITTITSPLIEVGSTIAIHLKPADFPKFTGKESEDIDEWIAQIMFFYILKGIGIMGNYTGIKSLNTFKSLIQCGITKNVIVKNFTLVGDVESTYIYEYYLKYLKNDTVLQYSNQASSTQFFCS